MTKQYFESRQFKNKPSSSNGQIFSSFADFEYLTHAILCAVTQACVHLTILIMHYSIIRTLKNRGNPVHKQSSFSKNLSNFIWALLLAAATLFITRLSGGKDSSPSFTNGSGNQMIQIAADSSKPGVMQQNTHGDNIAGDKVNGDKVGRDKITKKYYNDNKTTAPVFKGPVTVKVDQDDITTPDNFTLDVKGNSYIAKPKIGTWKMPYFAYLHSEIPEVQGEVSGEHSGSMTMTNPQNWNYVFEGKEYIITVLTDPLAGPATNQSSFIFSFAKAPSFLVFGDFSDSLKQFVVKARQSPGE